MITLRHAMFALALLTSAASAEPGKHLSFVTCPLYRDSVRQCWIAEHEGKLYYIGRFGMGPAPQLLHKVLIEGTVADEPDSCGATMLNPIYISPLPEIDQSCNTVLPDNGAIPTEPMQMQDMGIEMLALIGKPMPSPQPPFADRSYLIDYSFDSAFLHQLTQREVERAVRYVIGSKAQHVTVTGYRASVLLDSGQRLTEQASLPEARARGAADALVALGIAPNIVEVKWVDEPIEGTGVEDFHKRRTEISIKIKAPRKER